MSQFISIIIIRMVSIMLLMFYLISLLGSALVLSTSIIVPGIPERDYNSNRPIIKENLSMPDQIEL